MADYIIQKAVNADAVNKKQQRTLAEYGAAFEAQDKYDGCAGVINLNVSGGNICQSRTGEIYPSLDLRAAELANGLSQSIRANGGLVLIGEAWWPGKGQFSAISGEFRRLVPSAKLHFVINDVLTADEFAEGWSPVPYWQRVRHRLWPGLMPGLAYVAKRRAAGTYGDPQALCDALVEAGGYDGLVLRDPHGTWTRGNGTTGEIVKIKRVLSYDLRVTAVYEGVGKNKGRAGAIGVDFNGKELRVNCGTDEERRVWFATPGSIIDQIVEVEAMDLSSKGLLREPRFKGIRHDKLAPDTP
jgi:DNA ligase-1